MGINSEINTEVWVLTVRDRRMVLTVRETEGWVLSETEGLVLIVRYRSVGINSEIQKGGY